MTFLLDVNVLVALGFAQHEFHERVARWIRSQRLPALATCSITELGFVRVLSQASVYGFTVAEARDVLLRLKGSKAVPFTFLPDDHDVSHLPLWAKTANQTTDGHLLELARGHGAVLATLDQKIPRAHFIT